MKKFINILSWASFVFVVMTIVATSMYVGAIVCNWLADVLHIADTLWTLLLVPVLIVVATGVELFLVLGAARLRLS